MILIKKCLKHSRLTLIGIMIFSTLVHVCLLFIILQSTGNDGYQNPSNGLNITQFGAGTSSTTNQQSIATKKIKLQDLNNIRAVSKKEKQNPREHKLSTKLSNPIEKLDVNDSEINEFLTDSNLLSATSDRISDSDANFQIELPPGLKLNELNEAQLVLYNFRIRTGKQYFNSFYSNLHDHKYKKPHLTFPMTEEKERMTGKITYDQTGNIVKIQMLQVTNKVNLQAFFEDLLKRMHTISNPPEMILNAKGEFTVHFSLNVY